MKRLLFMFKITTLLTIFHSALRSRSLIKWTPMGFNWEKSPQKTIWSPQKKCSASALNCANKCHKYLSRFFKSAILNIDHQWTKFWRIRNQLDLLKKIDLISFSTLLRNVSNKYCITNYLSYCRVYSSWCNKYRWIKWLYDHFAKLLSHWSAGIKKQNFFHYHHIQLYSWQEFLYFPFWTIIFRHVPSVPHLYLMIHPNFITKKKSK